VSSEERTDNRDERRLRVLVTGHHGYIGSVLAPLVHAAGHDVVGLDTFYYRGCDFGPAEEWRPALTLDVRDVAPSALEGFDAVVHLAALSNDPVGDINADWTYQINDIASVKLAAAAKEAGVGRFVFASSCSMYGSAGQDELVSEDAPLRPLTPYAESKVRAEEAILDLASEEFTPVSMRNATAYGVSPRLRLDIVLNNLVAWAHATGSVRLQSDGSAWRPLVHIRDISKTTLALLQAPADVIRGEAFNVGSADQNYRIRTLAEVVRERLPHCSLEFAEGASADSRSYRVVFSKLEAQFPDCRLEWTAVRGADELATAYAADGITSADLTGKRYLRLGTIKYLLDNSLLDDDLRWTAPD
jgi:nucleoside-diphosphate-sugar epimerase